MLNTVICLYALRADMVVTLFGVTLSTLGGLILSTLGGAGVSSLYWGLLQRMATTCLMVTTFVLFVRNQGGDDFFGMPRGSWWRR